jgi:1,4-dihydroxy-6-naphthoate synthase
VLIRLGHSPDPDDAFMFWGLASGRVDPGEFEFEHVLRDIQTLNEWAQEGRLEVTAISLHTYPFVQNGYVLLPHGASMGAGYGPIVVSREPLTRKDLTQVEIAVPGVMTTAFLVLRLAIGVFSYRVVPFDQIQQAVIDYESGRMGRLTPDAQRA